MPLSAFSGQRSGVATALFAAALSLGAAPAIGTASPALDDRSDIYSDARVANFVAAERLDGGHAPVRLSFWSGSHGKMIEYDSGDGAEVVRLTPLDQPADGRALGARAPDGSIWTLTLSDGALLVDDGIAPDPRLFLWQYQGPVGGRGTACIPCVPEAEALSFVQDEFMQVSP